MIEAIILKPGDNIGVALITLKPGESAKIYGQDTQVKITDPVPYQHKFSIISINTEDKIIKDGVVIAKATQDIEKGQHVHTHNMTGLRLKGGNR